MATLEIFQFELTDSLLLFSFSLLLLLFLLFSFPLIPEENEAHLGSPPSTPSSSSTSSPSSPPPPSPLAWPGLWERRGLGEMKVSRWNREDDPTQFTLFDVAPLFHCVLSNPASLRHFSALRSGTDPVLLFTFAFSLTFDLVRKGPPPPPRITRLNKPLSHRSLISATVCVGVRVRACVCHPSQVSAFPPSLFLGKVVLTDLVH